MVSPLPHTSITLTQNKITTGHTQTHWQKKHQVCRQRSLCKKTSFDIGTSYSNLIGSICGMVYLYLHLHLTPTNILNQPSMYKINGFPPNYVEFPKPLAPLTKHTSCCRCFYGLSSWSFRAACTEQLFSTWSLEGTITARKTARNEAFFRKC